ncbi:MAG: hypothetical protein F6J89_17840 [Symploca sp. SIO1C4]|uniref:Uncharacterized protein n=1 Tax=Symploca sp. SIO1C4 TaxID=2607765 RepID=A0A6B3NFR0_9CYAN|nr:hypothetical protein [Symploca sp. SIO1C4]
MGDTYTGSKVATNDPGGAPAPNRSPQGTIVADGDPVNASSLQNGMRAAYDWIEWLRAPQAKAIVNVPIKRYRNAKGFTRHVIDRMGFPTGRYVLERQSWYSRTAGVPLSVGTHDTDHGYQVRISSVSAPLSNLVGFTSGNALGPLPSLVELRPSEDLGVIVASGDQFASFDDDVEAFIEFTANLNPGNGAAHYAGLNADLLSDPGAALGSGLTFWADAAGTNIRCQAASSPSVDTFAPKGTPHRFRIEWYGLNQDEDPSPVRRAAFFVNGFGVAEFTGAEVPGPGVRMAPYFAAKGTAAGQVQLPMQVYSQVVYGANTHAGDVV